MTHHSTFFRTALTRKFEEPENKEVLLADTRPYIFEFFIHWLYYGRFPNEDDDTELVELWTCHNNSGKTKTNNLIRLYIFCHRYDVPQLKVRAIDELFDHMENEDLEAKLPCSSITTEAYDTLPEGSAMCQFLVDINCYYADEDRWGMDGEHDPPAFLVKVLKRYSDYVSTYRTRHDHLKKCDYHEHQNDQEREACELNKIT